MDLNAVLSTVSTANFNLPKAAKELLKWHFRLGHLSFHKVQFLFRSGVLSHTESAHRLQTAACKITTFPKLRRLPVW
jgi:GAG-pre-integrase domain